MKSVGFEAFFTDWVPEKTEEIANAAARLGMFQQSIHSPFSKEYKVSHLWNGGEEGEFVTKSLIECVEDCGRFDIPVMVIHPFIGFKDHTPTQTGLDNYARVIEAANKAGVKLGFENVEGEEYLAAIMERFWNEPSLGFCLDTGHEMCYNRHKDMLALYGEKLCHTHFNDNLGVRGEEITFHDDLHLMPTDGIADWHGIMERIRKTGYDGILMSELTFTNRPGKNGIEHKYAEMTVEDFMREAYEKINVAISM
jgi:sugar phosphate isomerase/epimerase